MGGDRYTAKQFIDAIPGTGGIVSVLARRIGCDWWTAKRYITKYPTVKAAYEAECETVTDLAESVLVESIKEGNTQDAKWWLSRIRRDKFGDNLDITSGGDNITVTLTWGDNAAPDDNTSEPA
jgi:hypothetical protein